MAMSVATSTRTQSSTEDRADDCLVRTAEVHVNATFLSEEQ